MSRRKSPGRDYESFVAEKLSRAPSTGLAEVPELHSSLFPFQRDLVTWALRRGRAAVFADCGLGKSRIEAQWAKCVAEYTNRRVLILTPLAVAPQMVREARTIGLDAVYLREPSETEGRVVVTNYERLEKFDASEFGGVVLDESSILKAFDGKTRTQLIDTFKDTPFRLAATATPAPNDHVELGNHSEFLGIKPRHEMLAEYFAHDSGNTQDWRLKGHAVQHFWDWVSSWAVAVRKPSDLEYPDDGYILPGLRIEEHVLPTDDEQARAAGMLFAMPARGLDEQRAARRSSLSRRVQHVASLVTSEPNEPWLVWCELNDEGDALTSAIPGAIQVKGSDTPEHKEKTLLDFADGKVPVLVSKPSLAGFGMNFQVCARVAFVGVTHSFEQFFQAVRRCHRFGQKREVVVHVACSELETEVLASLRRKERDADGMLASMVEAMRKKQIAQIRGAQRDESTYTPPPITKPGWLRRTA